MKLYCYLPRLGFALLALGLASARLGAADSMASAGPAAPGTKANNPDEKDTSTIKFSDPTKPGTLRLTVANGDIRIHGADTPEISIRTELKAETSAPRPDGLRVLTSSSTYSLNEKNNVVTLSYGSPAWPSGGGGFWITVPRNTNVVVSNAFGGDIDVGDVTGDIEIKSLNGQVKLANLAGGASVETMNGEVDVTVKQLVEGKPLSFTSMNGEVKLHVPTDAKASVRLRTHNGSILTDFDDKQLVTKTASLGKAGGGHFNHAESAEIRAAVRDAVRVGMEAAREATRAARDAIREAHNGGDVDEDMEDVAEAPIPPMAPLPPMTGGKIVTGTLNGGGAEIRVTTMNGDVTLRKVGSNR